MKEIKSCGIYPPENIYFDWHLTNWCNYKCSYCPVLDVITNDFTTDDHASYKVILARLAHVKTTFDVCITGGEPTLHPNLIEILTGLSVIPACQDVSIFTNLSRPAKYYKQIQDIQSEKLNVFASFHPEFATDKFLDRCIELHNTGMRFSIHLTLSDNKVHWDKTENLIKVLRENNISFKPLLLAKTNNYTPNYTDEFYDTFKHYFDEIDDDDFALPIPIEYMDGTRITLPSHEFEIQQINKFKGYKCMPASYNIDIDGLVTNTCTREKAPLFLSDKNLLVERICPNEVCPGRRLNEFFRIKI